MVTLLHSLPPVNFKTAAFLLKHLRRYAYKIVVLDPRGVRGVDSLLPAFLSGGGKGEGGEGERWGREVEEEGGGEVRGHGRGEVGETSREVVS